jgi:hypothetical protein
MGYRSDLKAAFYTTPDRAAALKLYVDENFPEELKGELHPIDNGRYQGYMFEGDGWKWYDSYPEVIAFNKFVSNFLELAEQEEIRWAYEFVRVGEDINDVEETYSDFSDYQIRVVRSIDSDF